MEPDNDFLTTLKTSYDNDSFLKSDRQRQQPRLRSVDGLVYHQFEDRLYVTPALRQSILREAHSAGYSGHLGLDKTTATITRHYWWPHLRRSVAAFIRCCHSCQVNKPLNQRPYGLLRPLPTPDRPWQHITMDFAVDLPLTATGNDSIVVFVDRFSKMIRLAPTTKTVTAPQLAEVYRDTVFKIHGLPDSIVSDRDPKLDSDFWRELQRTLSTSLKMSTSQHPQTDGQSERAIRTVKEMLRAYVNRRGTNWQDHLYAMEFAYNNSESPSTKQSPFYTCYGYHPRTPLSAQRPSHVEPPASNTDPAAQASAFTQTLLDNLDLVSVHLRSAQLRQKHYADQHRRPHDFAVGQKVLLSNHHYKIPQCERHAFSGAWTGPFWIVDVTGETAKLRLPNHINIHARIHVSQLRHYHPDQSLPQQPPPPPGLVESSEEGEIWEISHICGQRYVRNPATGRMRKEYRVRYLYPPHNTSEHDEWKAASDLKAAHSTRVFRRQLTLGSFDSDTGAFSPHA